MSENAHILIVDDQDDIRDALCEHLARNGFETTGASDAATARDELDQREIDLVVLDIMMPGEDGLSLCRHLSETSKMPVILLTALADDTDRIVGLEIGADDYMTKPFNPRELIARIRSVLRRANGSVAPAHQRHFKFGSWRLDVDQCELTGLNEVVVPLSTGEAGLLKVFLENPSKVLSRDDLLSLTKGREANPFERSIDNMISRLRRKIEADAANPTHIKTIWGGGYQFFPTPDK